MRVHTSMCICFFHDFYYSLHFIYECMYIVSIFYYFKEIWYVMRYIVSAVKEFKRAFTTYVCRYVYNIYLVFLFQVYMHICMYIQNYSWQHHRTNQNKYVNQYAVPLATHGDNQVEDYADPDNQQIMEQSEVLQNLRLWSFT